MVQARILHCRPEARLPIGVDEPAQAFCEVDRCHRLEIECSVPEETRYVVGIVEGKFVR